MGGDVPVKPLLAHIYEPHRVTYPCYVQPKLNGIRALYQAGNFQSRDQLPFPRGLLAHLSEPLLQTFGTQHHPLDGELYVHGWPLQRINAAVTPVRQQPTEDTVQVQYHIFDVVDFNRPFIDRITTTLPFTYQCPPKIHLVNNCYVGTEWEADRQYAAYVNLGYEGMMYRLGDCPYTVPNEPAGMRNQRINERSRFLSDKNNRCWHLLKRKDWQDHEFECEGVVEGEGKLAGTLGALICKCSNGWGHFHVGSGLTDQQRHHYWRNPPIGKLIKVKYLVLSSDGIPLNPTVHPDHIVL